jgi:hypothetical protein
VVGYFAGTAKKEVDKAGLLMEVADSRVDAIFINTSAFRGTDSHNC